MTQGDPPRTVVRLRPGRAEGLEARLAATGPHLEPVLDIGRAPNDDLLVVVPRPVARLPDLLRVPGWPQAGEAVTVLVPLAQALGDLHAAGIAHGAVGPEAALLDADGAPYWAGPEAPVLRRLVGESAFAGAVDRDVVAFRALAGALCRSTGLPAPSADLDLHALGAALFAAAAALPVRLHPVAPAAPYGTPSRLLPAVAPSEEPAGAAVKPLRAGLRAVRLRVWVAAGLAAALLVAVPVLLPAEGSRSDPVATPSASARRTQAVPTIAPTVGPERALQDLVVARQRCLAAGSERCLAGVDAAGSPVLAADLAAVRAGVDAVRVDPDRLRLRTRSGGLALADAGGTTVLAVREPDGWRLRDVVVPPRG